MTVGFQSAGECLVLFLLQSSCAVLDITQNYWDLLLPGLESEREHVTFQVFFLLQRKKKGLILRGTCVLCQVSMAWRERTYKLSPYFHRCALPSQINNGSKKKIKGRKEIYDFSTEHLAADITGHVVLLVLMAGFLTSARKAPFSLGSVCKTGEWNGAR